MSPLTSQQRHDLRLLMWVCVFGVWFAPKLLFVVFVLLWGVCAYNVLRRPVQDD